jgi:membrane-bound lytic murein transglycosylase F
MGARGLMQILPGTYDEIKRQVPYLAGIDDPRWNIAAGIFYDRMLYRKWKKGLPTEQRLSFALASYNAGYGTINKAFSKAQKRHKEIKDWQQVAPYAPGQTRHYLQRINNLMKVEY